MTIATLAFTYIIYLTIFAPILSLSVNWVLKYQLKQLVHRTKITEFHKCCFQILNSYTNCEFIGTLFCMISKSTSAFFAHFCQNSGSSMSMSLRFVDKLKLALANVEPLTPASIWTTWVLRWRIWSMSSSQKSLLSVSSSITAPYAPFFSKSSISFFVSWFDYNEQRRHTSAWIYRNDRANKSA